MQCRHLHLEPSGSRAVLSAVRRESLIIMHDTSNKPELRKVLRERRRAIPNEKRTQDSISIARHTTLLPGWEQVGHIALYLATDGEAETIELTRMARDAGAALYLPVVLSDGEMHFALWETGAELIVNGYGIPEPGPDHPRRPAQELDIIFTPLVGWDESGARLGMGGGFYDRALSGETGPLRVGLGFECQRVETIPLEDWDIPLDFVVTETALYHCREEDRGKISPE